MIKTLASSRALRVAALVASVSAVACARVQVGTELAPTQRREAFERVWTEVNETYYDPGMNGADWPAAHQLYRGIVDTISTDGSFYSAMNRMLGLLHDSHTRLLPPTIVAQLARHEDANVGLTVREIDGRPTVVAVRAGSPAALAGIEPGMLVPAVNGVNTVARVARVAAALPSWAASRSTSWRAYTAVFAGRRDTSMRVTVERADGSTFDAALTAVVVTAPPEVDAHLLASGNAYIRWNIFRAPNAHDVAAAVERFRDAPGMILDLRGNPGGNNAETDAIVNLFLDRRTAVYQVGERHGSAPPTPTAYVLGSNGGAAYRGPIVILLNEMSGSASELLASGLQESGRAKLVGVETCGCVLGVNNGRRPLPDGARLDISAREYLTMHGEKLEGRGVIPDVRVDVTLDDLRARRDAVLEAADESLRAASFVRR